MNTIQGYIEEIQEDVIHFNKYWEDPITESALVKNPKETANEILGYCQIIETQLNGKKIKKCYESYNKVVQNCIDEIVRLVNDGRDLRHNITYYNIKSDPFDYRKPSPRDFDHHVRDNGYLDFENEPLLWTGNIIKECQELVELIESEAKTFDLKKYEGKYFTGNHEESGAYTIRVDKIYKKQDGRYTFNGEIIWWCTIDSRFDYDGILFEEAQDFPFDELLFVEYNDDEEGNTFKDYIESLEEETEEQVIKSIKGTINSYAYRFFRSDVY